jgi:hypothetical protein
MLASRQKNIPDFIEDFSMLSDGLIVPDFLLIGAQRCGTTWLWKFLNTHPGTDLPKKKEIHYYGGIENYRKGKDWYYRHFEGLSDSKVIGEASPTYLYDQMPYWDNSSISLEFDHALPLIPEIVKNDLPNVKILVILRDPVRRAISAYTFWLKKLSKNGQSPLRGLKKMALEHPKLRILELGYYVQHLKPWKQLFSPDEIRFFIFEEDVVKYPARMLHDVYEFIGIDPNFLPEGVDSRVHGSASITRIILNHFTASFSNNFIVKGMEAISDRFDFLRTFFINKKDIEFLRSVYLPQRQELESMINRNLTCWDYGASLL